MARHYVCDRRDIAENSMATFDLAGGASILLLRVDDQVYACDGVCPHQEVRLEDGLFDGEVLTCHQHMWQWKVATGEPVGLAECPLNVYRVDMEGEAIYVDPEMKL